MARSSPAGRPPEAEPSHGDEQIESQRTKSVVKGIGLIENAGRAVEDHVCEELVEAVFLGPCEVMAFQDQAGGGGLVDIIAQELSAAHDIGVVPKQVPCRPRPSGARRRRSVPADSPSWAGGATICTAR